MAYDFAGDPNCVSLWRFENGALTTDSIGTNTLDSEGSPTSDTVIFKEGAGSVDLEPSGGNDYFRRTDTNLSSDFPFKSGTSNKAWSLCAWIRRESGGEMSISSKTSGIGAIADYQAQILSGGIARLAISDGSVFEFYSHGTAMATGIWYHIAFTYDDDGKAVRIRIWDDNASAILGVDKTATGTKDVAMSTGGFFIGTWAGAAHFFDGWMDEVVVFNRVLTTDEIDEIRQGIPGGAGSGAMMFSSDF